MLLEVEVAVLVVWVEVVLVEALTVILLKVEVVSVEALTVMVLLVEVSVVKVDVVWAGGPFCKVSSSRHSETERMFRTSIRAPTTKPPVSSYDAKMNDM